MDDAVKDRGGLKFHIAVSFSNRESELARGPDHEFGRRDIGPCCVFVRGGLLDRSKNPRDIAEAGDPVLPHEDLFRSSEASCDSRLFHDRDRGQSMKPFKHVVGLANLHNPVPLWQGCLFFLRGGIDHVADQGCSLYWSLVLDISSG